MSQAKYQDGTGSKQNNLLAESCSASYLAHDSFFLSVLYNPEDGGRIFIRNVC
jgi:hypothetical protein